MRKEAEEGERKRVSLGNVKDGWKESDEKGGVCAGVISPLPPEATNALTFINSHCCWCVYGCVRDCNSL